jgi:radical SAM protein with 4Fe4S-binding SPASM domain
MLQSKNAHTRSQAGGPGFCLSLPDEFVEGNLRQTGLRELWESGQYFSRLRHKEASLSDECAACACARECRAGCSAVAWSATGSLGHNTHCLRSLEVEAILNGVDEGTG